MSASLVRLNSCALPKEKARLSLDLTPLFGSLSLRADIAATAGLCDICELWLCDGRWAGARGCSDAVTGLESGDGLLIRLTASADVKALLLLEEDPGLWLNSLGEEGLSSLEICHVKIFVSFFFIALDSMQRDMVYNLQYFECLCDCQVLLAMQRRTLSLLPCFRGC